MFYTSAQGSGLSSSLSRTRPATCTCIEASATSNASWSLLLTSALYFFLVFSHIYKRVLFVFAANTPSRVGSRNCVSDHLTLPSRSGPPTTDPPVQSTAAPARSIERISFQLGSQETVPSAALYHERVNHRTFHHDLEDERIACMS
jgi:hypothetical protein